MTSEALCPAQKLWTSLGLPEGRLSDLHLSATPDPSIDSSFKLGTVAQTTIGLSALSAAHFFELRTGRRQSVAVDPRHAILEFASERWWLINDELPEGDLFDELAGLYRAKDGYVRIHTNFPHHKQGILDVLKCSPTRESVQAALLQWDAQSFEDEVAMRKICATKFRSFEDWDVHPHASALKNVPPVELIKIADAPKKKTNVSPSQPLEGIRVLDLTRVLSGPVSGRTLAAHGADVLYVTSPNLSALPFLDKDTSRGKRTTQLDLTKETDREKLTELSKDADVFLQAYRPGGIADKGFSAADLAELAPGIVYASLTAYGWDGPWKDRRGFDSLVQNATGFGFAEAMAYNTFRGKSSSDITPRPLPCQAIDHAAGYLLAFGINAALCRTLTDGGSWEVRVSLAAVAQWIRSLGQLNPHLAFVDGVSFPLRTVPQAEEVALLATKIKRSEPDQDAIVRKDEGRAWMTAISHAAKMSLTPVRGGQAPLVLDAHQPRWLPRIRVNSLT